MKFDINNMYAYFDKIYKLNTEKDFIELQKRYFKKGYKWDHVYMIKNEIKILPIKCPYYLLVSDKYKFLDWDNRINDDTEYEVFSIRKLKINRIIK